MEYPINMLKLFDVVCFCRALSNLRKPIYLNFIHLILITCTFDLFHVNVPLILKPVNYL